jgi:hypothetical protein
LKEQQIKGKAYVSIFNGGVVEQGLGVKYGVGVATWQEFFQRQLWGGNEELKLNLVAKAKRGLDLLESAGYRVILVSAAPERYRRRIETTLYYPVNVLASTITLEREVLLKPWSYSGPESDAEWTAAMVAKAGADLFIGPRDVQALLSQIAPATAIFSNFDEAVTGFVPLAALVRKGLEVPNHAA